MSKKVNLINGDLQPSAANPHSWLPLAGDPPDAPTKIMYGVLRPEYRGWTNSAVRFARAKIEVGLRKDAEPWTAGAARVEVLLPNDADDRFLDPKVLMEGIDAEPLRSKPYILTYLTITAPTPRLHHQAELVRAYARTHLVGELGAGVLMVQHAPNRAGYSAAPHVHLLVTRRVGSLGLAEPVPQLTGDKGRKVIVDRFTRFRDSWTG